MAAGSVASQGITDFPSEWARLTAAGAVSSGEVKHERSNLVRRKQAHAHAHHALFGEMPRPTNLDGQQHGYQDFLSVAERRSKPVHRRGQGQAHWVGPSLRKGDRRRARKSGGSATSQHDARVGAQVQTEMERWTALPSGEVAVTHDGARGRDGVIKHQSRVPMHELNTQTSDPPAPEPQFQSQFDPPKLAPPLSNLGPTLQPALEKVAGVRSAINRRQTALRGGRGDCAKHSAWPEGPLLPAQERPTAAAVAMGRLALNPKIGPAQSMRAPPAAVDDEGMDYFQRGARGSSAHDFVGYAKARVSCGRRSPHRHTPIDYAARVGWARPAASVGNVSLPLKRRLRPPTPETGGVTRSPSKIFGGEASQTAVVHLSVGGESAIDGMPRIDLSGKNANADNPGSEEGTTGVGFRPWSDEETAALLSAVDIVAQSESESGASWETVAADMWAAGFQRNAQACQERHWWIHHKDIAVASNDRGMSMLEKAAAADHVLRQCLVHALRLALQPQSSPASGLPALAQIQQQVYSNLLSLPPKLQEGFEKLRLDAEKVPREAASNAAALADMLIATNTVHSFQLGDGDNEAISKVVADQSAEVPLAVDGSAITSPGK